LFLLAIQFHHLQILTNKRIQHSFHLFICLQLFYLRGIQSLKDQCVLADEAAHGDKGVDYLDAHFYRSFAFQDC
jgi:hypothetical protein